MDRLGDEDRLWHVPRNMVAGQRFVPLGFVFFLLACSEDPPARTFLDEPVGALPELLSDLGLYSDLESRRPSSRVIAYAPSLELWSNGSEKSRFIYLPEDTTIDNSTSDWRFPAGTIFFKTFVFPTDAGQAVPVETRLLRQTDGGWEYDVYVWMPDGEDAQRVDLSTPVAPTLPQDATDILHEVPSRRECRSCHESNDPGEVIGFDTLRLRGEPGADQLTDLFTEGVFAVPVTDPPGPPTGRNALETEVIGYIHGNCAHCHNGLPGASRSFDLRHPVAVENLVGMPTQSSGGTPGTRVVPGDPDASIAWLALDRQIDDAMPPIGVQLADSGASTVMRDWILSLVEEP